MEIEIHIDVYSWQFVAAEVAVAAIYAATVIAKIIKGKESSHD